MVDKHFLKTLDGYGLTTAEIVYGLPDHPRLLQMFLWQDYDLAPKFPNLEKFLDYWKKEIHGPLHSVKVAHQHLITPAEFKMAQTMLHVH
jgi:uncharacterized protein Usg